MMPLSAATSPPTLTWQYSLAICVEPNVTISIGSCGAANRSSARSRSGLITTIGAPRREALCSSVIIRGLLVPGILPDDEDRVGVVEILEQHRALADADAFRQADAGRLVAHVRAIGKVVRAEAAHEQLIQERRLVGGAAGGVEFGLVRIVQRIADARPISAKASSQAIGT